MRIVSLGGFLLAALASAGPAGAQTAPVPSPSPTASPLSISGTFRSYYFTRENASNNPGVQFDFAPGAKYNSNAVNQASLNNAIELHADYDFANGLFVGVTYLFATPLDGPCSVAANHAKAATYPSPSCTHQVPPNTNLDDTLPGFTLNTFDEAYIGYQRDNFGKSRRSALRVTVGGSRRHACKARSLPRCRFSVLVAAWRRVRSCRHASVRIAHELDVSKQHAADELSRGE